MLKMDDGTTIGGFIMAMLCIGCVVFGYTVRDRGLVIRFQNDRLVEQVR